MEMLITPEWLRNKIESEPDLDIEAGVPTEFLESIDIFLPKVSDPEYGAVDSEQAAKLKGVFGVFVRNLRLLDNLSREDLARSASVSVTEICNIEVDPTYQAKPRTVYCLAERFKIDVRKMMKLSGTAQTFDTDLEEKAFKFAAKSNGVSTLNEEEQSVLKEFVKYLNGS